MSDTIDSATLTSGISYGTNYSGNVGAERVGSIVFLSGYVACPAITSGDNQDVALTIPAGWRPKNVTNMICVGGTPAARVRVGNDGTVKISSLPNGTIQSGAFVQMSGISYIS